jgi:hypothetical protein
MEAELKPCPFCGRKAILQKDEDHHGGYFSLGCAKDPLSDDTCPGKSVYYTEPIENLDNAIKLWNTRPIEDALRATIASLRQQLDAALGQVAAARVLGSYDMECAQHRAITQSDTPMTASDGGAG